MRNSKDSRKNCRPPRLVCRLLAWLAVAGSFAVAEPSPPEGWEFAPGGRRGATLVETGGGKVVAALAVGGRLELRQPVAAQVAFARAMIRLPAKPGGELGAGVFYRSQNGGLLTVSLVAAADGSWQLRFVAGEGAGVRHRQVLAWPAASAEVVLRRERSRFVAVCVDPEGVETAFAEFDWPQLPRQAQAGVFAERPGADETAAPLEVTFNNAGVAGLDSLVDRAASLAATGRPGEAALLIRQALRLFGDRPHLYLSLATILEQDLDAAPEAVEAALRRAQELEPLNPHTLNRLAWLLIRQGKNLDEAVAMAGTAVDLEPQPPFLDTLGWGLHLRGHGEEALSWLLKAAEACLEEAAMPATDMVIFEHAAAVLRAGGRATDAAALLRRAQAAWRRTAESVDAGDPYLAACQGWALLETGDRAAALALLEAVALELAAAVADERRDALVYELLGDARAAAAQNAAAAAAYRRAGELADKFRLTETAARSREKLRKLPGLEP